jgi:hypothetical protein
MEGLAMKKKIIALAMAVAAMCTSVYAGMLEIERLETAGLKGVIHIVYRIYIAQPIHELDACLAQVDAVYTGNFWSLY